MKNIIPLILIGMIALGAMTYVYQNNITGDIIKKIPTPKYQSPVFEQPIVIESKRPTPPSIDISNYQKLKNDIDLLQNQICEITSQLSLTPGIQRIRVQNNCFVNYQSAPYNMARVFE